MSEALATAPAVAGPSAIPRSSAGPTPPRGTGRLERQRQRGLILLLLPAIVAVLAFFAYPLGYGIYMSLVDFRTATFITGEAPFVGLDNYVAALTSSLFLRALSNTLLFTVVSMAVQMVGGLLLALYFEREFPGNRWLSTLLLLPWLIPLVINTTTWKWMLQGDGIINRFLDVFGIDGPAWLADPTIALWPVTAVNTWAGLPFMATILASALRNVPHELTEAAVLDGAGYWRRLWSITLPMIRPVVVVMTILGAIATLKVLDLVLVLTGGGPANATQTLALLSYRFSFGEFQFGLGAAFGNLLLLVTVAIAILYTRLTRSEEAA